MWGLGGKQATNLEQFAFMNWGSDKSSFIFDDVTEDETTPTMADVEDDIGAAGCNADMEEVSDRADIGHIEADKIDMSCIEADNSASIDDTDTPQSQC